MYSNFLQFVLLRFKYFVAILMLALAVIIVAIAVSLPNGNSFDKDFNTEKKKFVKVAPISSFSSSSFERVVTGVIRSAKGADLRALRAGTVTKVYAKVGDYVNAGSVLVSVSNDREFAGILSARAEVESAEANLSRAEAVLDKVTSGPREEEMNILQTNVMKAQNTLDEAMVGALNSLSNSYATVENIILRNIDEMFEGEDGANPRLVFKSTNYAQRIEVNNERLSLQDVIERQRNFSSTDNDMRDINNVLREIDTGMEELNQIKSFLDTLLIVTDGGISTRKISQEDLDSYNKDIEIARASIIAAISSVSQARLNVLSANSALGIAKENEKLGESGARTEEIREAEAALDIARAGLSRARAGLAAANAVYEDTLIRSPISGILEKFDVKLGDFLNMYQHIGTVSGNENAEIVFYLSPKEAREIKTGDNIIVEERHNATVIGVSSATDARSGKVQVRAILQDATENFVNGESVDVTLQTNGKFVSELETSLNKNVGKVPISAIRFEVGEPVMFGVQDNNILRAIPIEVVEIESDVAIITHSLPEDIKVVIDARGLVAGDEVVIEDSK